MLRCTKQTKVGITVSFILIVFAMLKNNIKLSKNESLMHLFWRYVIFVSGSYTYKFEKVFYNKNQTQKVNVMGEYIFHWKNNETRSQN